MTGVEGGDAGGRVVIRLDASPSTNDDVRRRWADDATRSALPHLSTISTLSQTAGRGRLGREWLSPPGACLAISTIVRLEPSAVRWVGWLPLAAGLALHDALVGLFDRDPDATGPARARIRLKWPNDVLIDGRKVAGILGEVLGVDDHELACVIGTGINLRLTDDQLPVPYATSLALAGLAPVDDDVVERRYLAALAKRVNALRAASGDAVAAGLFADFTGACDTLGRRVRVARPAGDALVGEATGIDRHGQLVVRDDGGTDHVIAAGDVERVRPSEE